MHRFTSPLWRWEPSAEVGRPDDADRAEAPPGTWYFVTLPENISDDVDEQTLRSGTGGFGSVKVQVTVGSTTWSTSLFPDRSRGAFILPIKKAVRVAEGIEEGDVVKIAFSTL